MKCPLVTRLSSLAIAALAASSASAAEWFVSPTGDNAAAGTEAAPWRTIQFAVENDSVAANDTIILLPGDHVEGSTSEGGAGLSRANVTKPLTIRSKDGRASRDTTRIVGAYATGGGSSDPVGIGTGAIRGLRFASDASGSRVEGITFYRGSTGTDTTNSGDGGGGALVPDGLTEVDFVDCAFVECRARRGGGIYASATNNDKTRAVRCLFKTCADLKFGSAMRGGSAYFCVFDGNCIARSASGGTSPSSVFDTSNGKPAFSYGYRAVNCTFVNNELAGLVVDGTSCFNGGIYNNLFQRNQDGSTSYGVQFKGTTFDLLVGNGWVDALTNQVATTSKLNVFSPYDGDYRLTVDSDALGAGSAESLAKIPEEEFRYTDYNGATIDPAGPINAGAVQEALTEAASGIAFNDNTVGSWTLDGETVSPGFGGTWIGAVGWPVPQHLGFVPIEGRALVRFMISETPVWPLMDDTAWFNTWKVGIAQTVNVLTTANIYYADPVNGNDENDGLTEATALKTLNKAVHKTSANFVVRALPGDYCTATESYADNKNRVVVPVTLAGNLRVVAVEGPENTFITGASDETDNGTGANAVRCIAVASTNNYYAAFQGFTLRNGRTGSNAITATMGAALRNINNTPSDLGTGVLLDCVVTNCSGNRAATIAGGSAYRCKFYDCKSFNGGGQCLARYCSIVSSLFVGCGGKSQLFGNTAKGYNCTIYGNVGDAPQSLYNNGSGVKGYLYNCVSGRPSGNDLNEDTTDDQLVNTLYCRMSSLNPNTFTTAVKEEPLKLMDAAAGDYRLAPDSAGVWLASTANLKSCMDIDGKPFAFRDGRYQAGCHAVGSTLYVDAVNGSDANGGSSEADAFQTLAAAMAAADYGDTVLALPGTYNSGTMLQTLAQSGGNVEPALPARVVVKPGVTLASRDGAAATIIQGAASTDAGATSGCGEGAVRGVFLCRNATLRGFTVTDGHTLYGSTSSMTVNDYGGGVGGYYGAVASSEEFSALVEDCILTGNVACRGGGAMFGTFRNCVFTGNTLAMDKPGWAVARARLEGCFFSGNGVSEKHSAIYGCNVINCTILGGQAGNSGVICNENNYRYRPVFNSVIVANKVKFGSATNCVIGASATIVADTDKDNSGTVIRTYGIFTNNVVVADANLDANGVPLAGSPAIDAGDNALASAALLASRDSAGTRRVLNSTIDIGAYEYDWGVPWGEALGGNRLRFTDMPSDASLVDGALVWSDGTVEAAWVSNGNGASYTFTAAVTGAGTLAATANGDAIGTITAANSPKTISFDTALAANTSNALVFDFTGDGTVSLSGFSNQAPFVLIMK